MHRFLERGDSASVVDVEVLISILDEQEIITALPISDLREVTRLFALPNHGFAILSCRLVILLQRLDTVEIAFSYARGYSVKISVQLLPEPECLVQRDSLVLHRVARLELAQLPPVCFDGCCTRYEASEVWTIDGEDARVLHSKVSVLAVVTLVQKDA